MIKKRKKGKSERTSTQRSRPKGLTLMELLIALALVSLIVTGLLSLYTASQRYFISESSRADVLRDVRHVQTWVSRDIKEAVQVLPTWDAYTASDSCLILRLPSIDASGYIIDIEYEFDHVIYRLHPQISGRLERIVDAKDGVSSRADSSRFLATRVNSFQVSSEGVNLSAVADFSQLCSVDINLTSSKNMLGRSYQETLQTGVKLRNKMD